MKEPDAPTPADISESGAGSPTSCGSPARTIPTTPDEAFDAFDAQVSRVADQLRQLLERYDTTLEDRLPGAAQRIRDAVAALHQARDATRPADDP